MKGEKSNRVNDVSYMMLYACQLIGSSYHEVVVGDPKKEKDT